MARNKFLSEIHDSFERNKNSFAIFHVCDEQERAAALRYSELENVSNLLQGYFQRTFEPQEIWVGVCVQSKQWLIPILLGLWKSHMAFAAIDPQNQNRMMKALNLKYVISDRKILAGYRSTFYVSKSCFYIYKMPLERTRRCFPVGWDMCYGLCTSGSTGEPKLVQVPWSCIYPNAKELSKIFKITENDVISSLSPYTFDPFFIELFCSVLTGAMLLLPRETVHSASSEEDLNAVSFCCELVEVRAPKPTILQVTPSIFKLVFEEDYNSLKGTCSDLRLLIMGGEKFPLLETKHASCQVYNIYGVTEISCWSFLYEIPTGEYCSRVPIGTPLEGIVYKMEDGELMVGHESRKCLVEGEDPENLAQVTYRTTGDMVKVNPDTGQLYILTRRDNMIKKFGTKVPIEKIVSHVSTRSDHFSSFSLVYDATTQAIGLFVVCKDCTNPDYEICVEDTPWLSDIYSKLDDLEKPDVTIKIKMLPITSHGKADLNLLRDILKKEMCRRPFEQVGKTFEAIWCQVLCLKRPELEKSFTESGGNSILGLKLIARLNLLKIRLPETLITHLLDSFKFKDCCSLIIKANETASTIFGLDFPRKPELSTSVLSLKWSFDMKKCVDAPPKLFQVDGTLYVAVGSHSAQLSAVSCSNGRELWTVFLGDRIESGIAISPDQELMYTGSYDKHFYCLTTRTGQIVWKFRSGGIVKSTPCLSADGALVYCGSYDKQLYCFDAKNGAVMSSIPLGGSVLATPLISGYLLYVGTLDGGCLAVDAESLRMVWETTLKSPIFSSPCVLDDDHHVLFAEVEGWIHCFNTKTGHKEWEIQCGGHIFSGLTVVPEKKLVTFGCHDRHLYLLKTSPEPVFVWRLQLESAVACTPAVSNGMIFCVASSGKVYLVDLEGCIQSTLKLNGEAFSAPVFYGDFAYLGCRDDHLVCVDVRFGETHLVRAQRITLS